MWVDDEWMLLTGNNLNPRAWRLDLENAILIHDPKHQLGAMREKELNLIRKRFAKYCRLPDKGTQTDQASATYSNRPSYQPYSLNSRPAQRGFFWN